MIPTPWFAPIAISSMRLVELRQGSGAFVRAPPAAQRELASGKDLQSAIERLVASGLTEDEIRRLFENELTSLLASKIGG